MSSSEYPITPKHAGMFWLGGVFWGDSIVVLGWLGRCPRLSVAAAVVVVAAIGW